MQQSKQNIPFIGNKSVTKKTEVYSPRTPHRSAPKQNKETKETLFNKKQTSTLRTTTVALAKTQEPRAGGADQAV